MVYQQLFHVRVFWVRQTAHLVRVNRKYFNRSIKQKDESLLSQIYTKSYRVTVRHWRCVCRENIDTKIVLKHLCKNKNYFCFDLCHCALQIILLKSNIRNRFMSDLVFVDFTSRAMNFTLCQFRLYQTRTEVINFSTFMFPLNSSYINVWKVNI